MWVQRSAAACVTSAEPQVAMHFWKRPGRKEARTEKEVDGTGLLARSATKPIPVHDLENGIEWGTLNIHLNNPCLKSNCSRVPCHEPNSSLPSQPPPHGTEPLAPAPAYYYPFILHKVSVSLSCSPWKALAAETARTALGSGR